MSSPSNNASPQESISGESWEEFGRTQAAAPTESDSVATSSPVKLASVNSKALEKLLLDAQKESSYASSRIDSLASSRASPHSQHSPVTDLSTNPEAEIATSLQIDDHLIQHGEGDHVAGSNWVWDWSSRPETVQPSSLQFKHPVTKKHRFSIRNGSIMRGIVFSLENLPLLIFTHAFSFVLGAASMMYYLKRFNPCSTVSSTTSFGS